MPRDYELDRIKAQEQAAFQRKQSAWASYKSAKDRADYAYEEMQSAWDERVRARNEMNREFEQMQAEKAAHDDVWDEYGRIRDSNNMRIDYLRQEADSEHQAMQRCFEQASYEYEYGDRAMASVYSQEGHEHKDRRDELNYEISALCNEVKEAKQNAQWRT
ncbi:putative nuclear RNA export factor SDE5 [Candidatus Saccharibacteria bacterium]|nr:putative nuclear RNA export factor SDE5 [Candidatus Saccharibacteria bacterium]